MRQVLHHARSPVMLGCWNKEQWTFAYLPNAWLDTRSSLSSGRFKTLFLGSQVMADKSRTRRDTDMPPCQVFPDQPIRFCRLLNQIRCEVPHLVQQHRPAFQTTHILDHKSCKLCHDLPQLAFRSFAIAVHIAHESSKLRNKPRCRDGPVRQLVSQLCTRKIRERIYRVSGHQGPDLRMADEHVLEDHCLGNRVYLLNVSVNGKPVEIVSLLRRECYLVSSWKDCPRRRGCSRTLRRRSCAWSLVRLAHGH